MKFNHDLSSRFKKKQKAFNCLNQFLHSTSYSGQLYRFTQKKRDALSIRLHRLKRQVEAIGWQLKIAALGTTISLANTDDAAAQSPVGPFILQSRANNPLRHPIKGNRLAPTVVDLDNDGDYDIVVGQDFDYIKILLNEGTPNEPKFSDFYLLDESLNPIFAAGAPSFADLDGDNDMDMIFGDSYSSDRIRYFVNNGGTVGDPNSPLTFTEQFGLWDSVTKQGNPFESIQPGSNKKPFFVNFDGDGDMDVLIGHDYSFYGDGLQIHYFVNDGNSNFTETPFPTSPAVTGYSNYGAAPNLTDVDGDGQLDLVVGNRSGELLFFKGNGGAFAEQTGTWDAIAKTGNPFNNITADFYTVPAFADLDNDGDLDMVLGNQRKYSYYSSSDPLRYFLNTSNSLIGESAVFEEKAGFENPFGGIDVGYEAAPVFVQLDAGADMDVLLGSKYEFSQFNEFDSRLRFLKNTGGAFEEKTGIENPFTSIIPLIGNGYGDLNAQPHLVNLDADADLEVVVNTDFNEIQLFDKIGADFVELTGASNPFGIIDAALSNQSKLTFGDIDGDGDPDVFVSDFFNGIKFFRNTGTPDSPLFEEQTGTDNPLDAANGISTQPLLPTLIDIDNDGDLDAIIPKAYGYLQNSLKVFYFENTGSPTAPQFTQRFNHPFEDIGMPTNALLAFIDYDLDGDVDFFAGDYNGQVKFFLNDNPSPATTFNVPQVNFSFGSGPVVLDANLTLSDTDGDLISRAIVAIQNFLPGEEVLTFAPQAGISGVFDAATGVLTLTGQATAADYQNVLRSIRYEFIGSKPASGGRKENPSGKTVIINKAITFEVLDSDFTTPVITSIALQLNFANEVPVVAGSASFIMFTGTPIIINGSVALSDADDADLEGATVRISPASFVSGQDVLIFTNQNGISGSYNTTNGTLSLTGISSIANYQAALRSVQYQNSNTAPSSQIRIIEFTVTDGENNSNTEITQVLFNVNQPPAIVPTTLLTVINGLVSLDLSTIISDPDGNLDPNSFNIVQNPSSGALATISNGVLTVNYAATSFAGTDTIIIEAFDLLGERTEATITINVAGDVIVKNGISANGDDLNPIFLLENIEILAPDNQVSIFNRWGDTVFEIDRYDNNTRRFDGTSDDGGDLPSGVYFYKIKLNNGQPDLEGYLTLKR